MQALAHITNPETAEPGSWDALLAMLLLGHDCRVGRRCCCAAARHGPTMGEDKRLGHFTRFALIVRRGPAGRIGRPSGGVSNASDASEVGRGEWTGVRRVGGDGC